MTGGVETLSPMQALRALSEHTQASRPLAELRRPVGLPLPEVWMAVPVTLDELSEGSIWPPTRGLRRRRRMDDQHAATRGDYSTWLPNYAPDIVTAPISSLVDDVRSIMSSTLPEIDEPEELLAMIGPWVGSSVHDLITHGRTVAAYDGTVLRSLDMRYTWPLWGVDDGWVTVKPTATPLSQDGDPDAAAITVYTPGQSATIIRRLDASNNDGTYGTLGAAVASMTGPAVTVAHYDNPPTIDDWGEGCDQLIPLAVALARRESGVDYSLDRFEVPLFQIGMANADASQALLGVESSRPLTESEIRTMVPTLLGHDVLLLRDGYRSGEFAQATLSTDKALNFLARLDQRWTQKTGQVPVEQADTGDVSSGVAVARRQARLVARSRERHTGLLGMLQRLLGRPVNWPYVSDMMDDPHEDDDPPDAPPVGDAPEPDDA